MVDKNDLAFYVQDLKNLLLQARSPQARDLIKAALNEAQKDLEDKKSQVQLPSQEPQQPQQEEVKFEEMKFVSLTDYAFEDCSTKQAKVYITKGLDGIKANCPQENVQCEFESHSIDLKIRDFNGKNFRFRIDPLFDSLAVEGCKLTIKSNSISLTLAKENEKEWKTLKWVKPISQQDKAKAAGGQQAQGPVNDELMTLMQDLYKQGGDDVKKTISEAWTKAQEANIIK